MQLSRDTTDGNFIRSFSPGELRINDVILHDAVILTVHEILTDWSPPDVASLSITHFEPALDRSPEVIIFGSGSRQIFPPAAVTTDIMKHGIGFEVMDTGAACRTFNVLASEYRRVVAALLVH